MRILIVGSTGQLGWEIARCCPAEWSLHAVNRDELDMTQPAGIASVIQRRRPQVIVNASGYTAVDRAESEPELARLINAESVAALAHEARAVGAMLVHFSTDYVFDGRKTAPYLPGDNPNPQSVYGRSKLEGEQAVISSGARFLVLRTQWVYGLRGRNFVLAILRQGLTRPELRVVNDQIGAPTWARSIARGVAGILSRGIDKHQGVYHLACAGSTTWHDFARAVFDEALQRLPGLAVPRITPVSTQEYAAKAARPAHAVLDCTATARDFGVQLPHWRDALREAMSDDTALREALTPASASPASAR